MASSQIVGVRFDADAVEALERIGALRGERSVLVRIAVQSILCAIERSAKKASVLYQVPSFPIKRAIVASLTTGAPLESRLSRSKKWLSVVAAPSGLAWRMFAGSTAFEETHGYPLTWRVAETLGFGLRWHLAGDDGETGGG